MWRKGFWRLKGPEEAFSEMELLQRYNVEPGSNRVLIDVGAHRGSFSQPFAKRQWKVVAFEPEKENFAALKRSLGGSPEVLLIDKAVSNVTGSRVPFYVSAVHHGIHSLHPFHRTHELAYLVQTIRLDDALHALNVPEVTILKIDIEGADLLALQGFDFARYRPEIVMVEFMDRRTVEHYGYTHHDVVSFMVRKGYYAYVSEWEPVRQYGSDGRTAQHRWQQCAPYPLRHEPAWGNLIFVQQKDAAKFESTLQRYLAALESDSVAAGLRRCLRRLFRRLPFASDIHRLVKQRHR